MSLIVKGLRTKREESEAMILHVIIQRNFAQSNWIKGNATSCSNDDGDRTTRLALTTMGIGRQKLG